MNLTRSASVRNAAALTAVGIMGVALLAGCSSSSDSAESSAASASAAGPGNTSMLPPVIVTEDQTSASCKVGDALDIIVPEDAITTTTIASSDEAIVSVTQPEEDGGAFFNAGGECLAPGSATLTLTAPDGTTRDLAITVAE